MTRFKLAAIAIAAATLATPALAAQQTYRHPVQRSAVVTPAPMLGYAYEPMWMLQQPQHAECDRRRHLRLQPVARDSSQLSFRKISRGGNAPASRLCSRNSLQRLEPGLDLLAPVFEERRQHQFVAELVERLVHRKARALGCDLEQDAVRLAEIEASGTSSDPPCRCSGCASRAAAPPRRRNRSSGLRNAT